MSQNTPGEWVNPDLKKVKPYQPGRPIEEVAREIGLSPAEICKLASNENALGVSPKALEAMRRSAAEMHRYPDGSAYYLRLKAADKFQVNPENLIFGAGSNELLEFIAHAWMGPERSIIVSQYAFVIYKLLAVMFGSEIIEVEAQQFGHDLEAMAAAVRPDTRVVFVCNPNNPTGTAIGEEEIAEFVEKIPPEVLIVFDEAYAEISLKPMPKTLERVLQRSNCMMLRTFSKAYGLAGLRIGFGIGPEPLIAAMEKPRQPFNTNRMAQEAATAALDDDKFLADARSLNEEASSYFAEECRNMGLPFTPTATNFILVETGNGGEISQELSKQGIIVRPLAPYGLPEHLRITFGTMKENRRCIQALRQVLRR